MILFQSIVGLTTFVRSKKINQMCLILFNNMFVAYQLLCIKHPPPLTGLKQTWETPM